tara:strand:+ start:258 stop:515 length:258 start_codon:yes stop_codon:yes gene_type:complete
MSGDQTKELDVVVSAYRIYQRMMEVGTRHLQSLAFRQYRTEAVEYHKAWGVWPRYATTRNMGARASTPSPERLANMVIHQHMDHE